jgi:hypothetical protein
VPEYALVELVHGLNADAVHVAAALTYTLAMLLAALVAMGRDGSSRERLARAAIAAGIMIAPQLDAGTYALLNSPDHFGTSVPVLLAWLLLDRLQPRWWVPVAIGAILAWAALADMVILVVAAVPLAVTCAYRVLRGRLLAGKPFAAQRYEIALAAAGLVAAVVALEAARLLAAVGGPAQAAAITQLSPLNVIFWHNLRVTGWSLLVLAGADFVGVQPAIRAAFELVHLVGAALGACAIAIATWRYPRDRDLIAQLLIAGIAINLVAFAAGTHAVEITYAREITPVLPLAAALAGRLLAGKLLASGRLARRVTIPVLTLALCGYLAGLVYEVRQPAVPAQNQAIVGWLEAHHLKYGLSGYWGANVVSLTSGGHVKIRPLNRTTPLLPADKKHGGLQPAVQLVQPQWFDPDRETANFVLFFPTSPGSEPFTGFTGLVGFTSVANATNQFGRPAKVYHFERYTILVWNKNLLADMTFP